MFFLAPCFAMFSTILAAAAAAAAVPPGAKNRSTQAVVLATTAASVGALALWRVLQWRARRRARQAAERAQRMVQEGAMIDCFDDGVTARLVETATKRASKWLSYQSIDNAAPMIGQVGGLSFNKRPVLTLPPDYVLKPLHTDHRGFREIAFYEAVKVASLHGRRGGTTNVGETQTFSTTSDATLTSKKSFAAIEKCDALAMMLALFLHDAIVAQSEHTVVSSWKALHKEIELLKRLSSLTASYYGVVAQNISSSNPNEVPSAPPSRPTSEITSKSYLLLSDLTANFSKPCAVDIKIGRQSYEPGAAEDKKLRERNKYLQQEEIGFRIVGIRIYDPSHPESDAQGFRQYDKHFGRSLETRELVQGALRDFFSSYCHAEVARAEKSLRPRRTTSHNSLASLASKEEEQPLKPMLRARALTNILQQLRVLTRWHNENKCLAFYSSSIFMVFEGNPSAGSKDLSSAKMIDFGHVVRQTGGDSGYRYGLKQLTNMLTEILQEQDIKR